MGTVQVAFEEVERGGATGSDRKGRDFPPRFFFRDVIFPPAFLLSMTSFSPYYSTSTK